VKFHACSFSSQTAPGGPRPPSLSHASTVRTWVVWFTSVLVRLRRATYRRLKYRGRRCMLASLDQWQFLSRNRRFVCQTGSWLYSSSAVQIQPLRCPSPLRNAANWETFAVSCPKLHFLGSAAESKMVHGYTAARIDLSSRRHASPNGSSGSVVHF
jgi:hypothetical protein